MLKREWHRYLAIAAVAATVLTLSGAYLAFRQYQTDHAIERADTTEPGNGSVYELKAQQDVAEWAYAALWISLLGVVLTGGGVVYVALTLNETRQATAAANKAADAAVKANQGFADTSYRELRAYVSLSGIEGSVMPGQNNSTVPPRHYLTFTISVGLKNTGRTPAKSVVRVMEVWPFAGSTINALPPGMLGFSGNKKRLDIGPDQPFVHRYVFECEYRPSWLTNREGHSYAGQPGIEIKGSIEYTDFQNKRWRIPYACRSDSFPTEFNPSSLEPWPIGFGELEQAEEERAEAGQAYG